jgi:hypothetical protein
MEEERITESALQDEVLRGQVMKTPDDVAAMMPLKSLGWGAKRIARELGCSHHTVKGEARWQACPGGGCLGRSAVCGRHRPVAARRPIHAIVVHLRRP